VVSKCQLNNGHGPHALQCINEVIFAIYGSLVVEVFDANNHLDNPAKGLFIPKDIWFYSLS